MTINPGSCYPIFEALTKQLLADNGGIVPDLHLKQSWKIAARYGFTSLLIPQQYGGKGLSMSQACEAIEAIAYNMHDFGFAFALTASNFHSVVAILEQNDDFAKDILRRIAAGEAIVPNAITEPNAGSDIFSIPGRIEWTKENAVLEFTKTFITNAGPSTHFLLHLNEKDASGGKAMSAFLIENSADNCFEIQELNRYGFKKCSWGKISATGKPISTTKLMRIGEVGDSKRIFFHCIAYEKLALSAFHQGISQYLISETLSCSKGNKTERQFFRHSLAACEIELQASRQLLRMALDELNSGNIYSKWIAGIKYLSSAVLLRIVQTCSPLLLENGTPEAAEIINDCVTSSIYAGTSEMQLNIFRPHF